MTFERSPCLLKAMSYCVSFRVALYYPKVLIAVSSATTSTLVVDADEIPQYIEGIIEGLGGVVDEGARRGR